MYTNDILARFDDLPFFTIEGYKQLLEEQFPRARYAPTTLYRWMKAGKIIQLKKGVYMTRRFYELHVGDENFMPAVSAMILPQSYLSLEYGLQRNGVLTEVTYPVTAVTMKNTRTITNPLGAFSYRHIKPDLYGGFSMKEYHGIPFAQASKSKALFDYLYFRPAPGSIFQPGYDLAEDLRLNLEDFTPDERGEFAKYVSDSGLPKMNRIYQNLQRTIWRP